MKKYALVMLIALTFSLAGAQSLFSQEERGKAAFQEALPEELRDLDLKDYYVACHARAVGTIQTMVGHLVIVHSDSGQGYFAVPGDAIFENDVIYTLQASRCRIRFSTQDVITMAEDSQISVDEFIDDHEMEKKKSTFNMLKGKAMFYVVPLFRYKDTSVSVETPNAIAGVRGTKFGIGVSTDMQTMVYGFEGEVEVYSPMDGTTQTVGEGESLQLTGMGADDVQDMSYRMAEQFMSDTEAPAPSGEEAGQGNAGVGEQAGAVEEEAGSTDEEAAEGNESPEEDDPLPLPIASPSDPPQEPPLEPPIPPEPTLTPDQRPSKHWGYFVGMLTKDNTGSNVFITAYRTMDIQNFDSGTVTARDGSFNYMYSDGSSDYDDQKITSLETPDGNIISGLPVSVQHAELDHNAYMEWGYWIQPSAMSNGTDDFYFDNRGYYCFGDYTTDAQISDLAANDISGTYSGSANGTFWTPTGGANMEGTFSSHVSFNSGSITDFGLSVSGNGHSASISGASGAFSGPSSRFTINGNTGTWEIDEQTNPDIKAASGSVYGSNGNAMGGVWEIHHSGTSKHAVGVFQGIR